MTTNLFSHYDGTMICFRTATRSWTVGMIDSRVGGVRVYHEYPISGNDVTEFVVLPSTK